MYTKQHTERYFFSMLVFLNKNLLFQEWLSASNNACVLFTFSLHYFVLTNFFWMFVEGKDYFNSLITNNN